MRSISALHRPDPARVRTELEVLGHGEVDEGAAPFGHVRDPDLAAASGPPLSCLPSSSITPERDTIPEIARSVVVFPAPFAPSTATTSPSRTTRETSYSACTGP